MDALLERLDLFLDRLRRGGWGDAPAALLLIAPAGIVLFLFSLLPLGESVLLSLYGGKHGRGAFVGAGNYAEALGSDGFWRSVWVTVYYTLGTVPLTIVLSFLIAWGLYRIVWARGLLRTVYFLPYVTSAVAAAMVWRAMLNPQSGLVNGVLVAIGLEPQQWLLEPRGVLHLISDGAIPAGVGPSLALCCVIAFDVWHNLGFMVVVFLAGLVALPRELLDAARVDGAGAVPTLAHVVLPVLSPTIFFLLVVGVVRALQSFNSFYALTQGGGRTLGTTENMILHIYSNFYEYGYWGYGAAAATMLSAAIIALTLLQWRFLGRRVFYQ